MGSPLMADRWFLHSVMAFTLAAVCGNHTLLPRGTYRVQWVFKLVPTQISSICISLTLQALKFS